eukprot:TRINITY_DN1287_c0_g1_i2.p1 TRINITY_DN1287_c0_g1~~TRINITY_DN1287_c0_g1_i2.p1  ORF type:complete len:427 (+),score=95.70 TRINITY_DN1287_c0_g1_i2:87-1367(+)
MQKLFTTAEQHEKKGELDEAVQLYRQVILSEEQSSDETNKLKEDSALRMALLFKQKSDASAIGDLVTTLRPFFATVTQARTGKIVRSLIDIAAQVPDGTPTVIKLCQDNIIWAETEKRTFLRLHLQNTLAEAYYKIQEHHEALTTIKNLLREVKKLDDKMLLITIFLLESKIQHALQHLPRARAALTAARSAANAIYCPPSLQAELDMHSGTLHAEERDYKTAYSYFYEAYENYDTIGSNEPSKAQARDLAVLCLKYMLLTKIISGSSEETSALMSGKLALSFTDPKLAAMRAIAKAYQQSSLGTFRDVIEEYREELSRDPVIHRHLQQLYQSLLEKNLLRIVMPFEEVEISHIASLIQLDVGTVEKKLSQMILDKKLKGILDQGNDCLIVFDEEEHDGVYPATLEVISSLGSVVDSLYNRANRLR